CRRGRAAGGRVGVAGCVLLLVAAQEQDSRNDTAREEKHAATDHGVHRTGAAGRLLALLARAVIVIVVIIIVVIVLVAPLRVAGLALEPGRLALDARGLALDAGLRGLGLLVVLVVV